MHNITQQFDITLLEISSEGFVILNADGKLNYINSAAGNILGISSEQHPERYYNSPEWKITDFEENALDDSSLPFRRVRETNAPVSDIRHMIEWPNGKKVYLSINAAPITGNDGRFEGVITCIRDISDHILAQEKLKLSERRYQDLFNNLSEEVHVWKYIFDEKRMLIDWELVDANSSALNNWEKELAEVKGKRASEIFGSNSIEMFYPIVEEIRQTGRSKKWIHYFEPTGQYLSMESIPMGELFISTGRDISDLKHVENELRVAKTKAEKTGARLLLAAKSANLGIWDWDIKKDHMYWDDRMYEMYGLDKEKNLGSTELWLGTMPAEDQEMASLATQEALRNDKPFDITFRVIKPDGKEVYIKADGMVLRDKNRNPQQMIGINRDITEAKRREMELERSIMEKEALLMEVHHRVKNNLALISSILYLQEKEYKDDSYSGLIKETQSRIKSIANIHELIYQNESFVEINADLYIRKIQEQLNDMYSDTKNIRYHIQIEPLVLSIEQSIPLAMIVNEVLTNCFKHAFSNSSEGSVHIWLEQQDNMVHLKICDDGKGISEDIDLSCGDSLGMVLIQQFTMQLEGTAGFEANKPKGTCFELSFKFEAVT